MRILKFSKALLLSVAFMLPTASFAAGFIRIDGIPGESTDDKHDKWIDVLSFSLEGAREGRKCNIEDFSFAKGTDAASVALFMSFYNGKVFPEIELDVTKRDFSSGGESPGYFNIKFFDASLTNVRSAYSDGDDQIEEQIKFNFGSAVLTYYVYNIEGRLIETQMESLGGC